MGPWAIGTIALGVFAVLMVAALMWHDKRRCDRWLAELEADWDTPDSDGGGLGRRSL